MLFAGLVWAVWDDGGLGADGRTVVAVVCLAVPLFSGAAVLWWFYAGSALWETPDALVVRRRRGRWVRIPWSELRGVTWLRIPRVASGPAVTTTDGGRYERPNADWWTIPCEPMLPLGSRAEAAALRAAAERHGVPWVEEVEQRWIEGNWNSDRWDW